MSQKRQQNAIGFPPPLLGEAPLRLPVLAETTEWVALDKPAGIAVREYPWDGVRPNMDAALNSQLQAGKPELVQRGADLFGSVYYMDPEMSGVAVFAKQRQSLAELRNSFGSAECVFTFTFLSAVCPAELNAEFEANAPLLAHRTKPKMIPSTANGKKSSTQFSLKGKSADGRWTLWEARTRFFRPHHIRAHAAVHGISVLGDELYDGAVVPTLRELKLKGRGEGLNAPALERMPLHLTVCQLSAAVSIRSEIPKPLQLFMQRAKFEVTESAASLEF
ncbi:MAG: 23S rRNA-/tRNA-specific pseudouridylate synthase [Lentimonas sp.]